PLDPRPSRRQPHGNKQRARTGSQNLATRRPGLRCLHGYLPPWVLPPLFSFFQGAVPLIVGRGSSDRLPQSTPRRVNHDCRLVTCPRSVVGMFGGDRVEPSDRQLAPSCHSLHSCFFAAPHAQAASTPGLFAT